MIKEIVIREKNNPLKFNNCVKIIPKSMLIKLFSKIIGSDCFIKLFILIKRLNNNYGIINSLVEESN
jgi:hypothetical protein